MRAINDKYVYYPKLKGDDLPYDFEIELSGKVYYRKDGALRKADATKSKRTGKITISIEDYTIIVFPYNQTSKQFKYEVKKPICPECNGRGEVECGHESHHIETMSNCEECEGGFVACEHCDGTGEKP